MKRIVRCALVMLALGLGAVGFGPADALARQSMSFSLGDHARPRGSHVVRYSHAGRGHARSLRAARVRARAPVRTAHRSGDSDEGDTAKAVPGKGFTLENGILTYPAPARFQPRNLRAH